MFSYKVSAAPAGPEGSLASAELREISGCRAIDQGLGTAGLRFWPQQLRGSPRRSLE